MRECSVVHSTCDIGPIGHVGSSWPKLGYRSYGFSDTKLLRSLSDALFSLQIRHLYYLHVTLQVSLVFN